MTTRNESVNDCGPVMLCGFKKLLENVDSENGIETDVEYFRMKIVIDLCYPIYKIIEKDERKEE